jgi:hypothetical protein
MFPTGIRRRKDLVFLTFFVRAAVLVWYKAHIYVALLVENQRTGTWLGKVRFLM